MNFEEKNYSKYFFFFTSMFLFILWNFIAQLDTQFHKLIIFYFKTMLLMKRAWMYAYVVHPNAF